MTTKDILYQVMSDYCNDYEQLSFVKKELESWGVDRINTDELNNFITKYEAYISMNTFKISNQMSYNSKNPQEHPHFGRGILDYVYKSTKYKFKYLKVNN